MAKPEWGVKRVCAGCGARFYDMRRDPIVCPKCGVTHDPLAQLRPQRQKVAAPAPKAEPEAEEAAVEEEELLVEDDVEEVEEVEEEAEDDDSIEDASELGEDADDMFEVMDNVEEDGEEER